MRLYNVDSDTMKAKEIANAHTDATIDAPGNQAGIT